MIRSWGLVTFGTPAIPWFGDALTAAVTLPGPGIDITVTVASTTRYAQGDRIVLDPLQTNQDILLVDSIKSATVLLCRLEGGGTPHTHANGALLLLSIACADVLIQNLSTADPVVLGTDNTVTLTPGGSAYYVIAFRVTTAQPSQYNMSPSATHNINRTSDGWMIGTNGQTALVSARVL